MCIRLLTESWMLFDQHHGGRKSRPYSGRQKIYGASRLSGLQVIWAESICFVVGSARFHAPILTITPLKGKFLLNCP